MARQRGTLCNGEAVLRESILETQVDAALAGHDLGPFERVENGYQARCRRCGQTAWVGESGGSTAWWGRSAERQCLNRQEGGLARWRQKMKIEVGAKFARWR
jgi:hypothetical protein